MSNTLDDSLNERYRLLAEGKEPEPVVTDILWITPKRLGVVFGLCLLMTVLTNGIQ